LNENLSSRILSRQMWICGGGKTIRGGGREVRASFWIPDDNSCYLVNVSLALVRKAKKNFLKVHKILDRIPIFSLPLEVLTII
jgi:hypothetical protein